MQASQSASSHDSGIADFFYNLSDMSLCVDTFWWWHVAPSSSPDLIHLMDASGSELFGVISLVVELSHVKKFWLSQVPRYLVRGQATLCSGFSVTGLPWFTYQNHPGIPALILVLFAFISMTFDQLLLYTKEQIFCISSNHFKSSLREKFMFSAWQTSEVRNHLPFSLELWPSRYPQLSDAVSLRA